MGPEKLTIFLVVGSLLSLPRLSQAQGKPDQREREQRAIDAIEKVRGSVAGDEGHLARPVTQISFDAPIKDEHLGPLTSFPSLRHLFVREGKITDTGLAHLKGLTRLEWLEIRASTITDAGLAHLKGLARLDRLDLSDVPITDAGLANLKGSPRLRMVHLWNTEVTDAGVAKLRVALPYALVSVWRDGETAHTREGSGHFLLMVGVISVLAGGAAVFLFWCPWRPVRQRRWVWKLPVVLAVILAMGAALLRLTPIMNPVREGDPATFWLHAAKIDVGVEKPWLSWGDFYQPRHDWLVYYTQEIHGQRLYRVKASEAVALFPKVVDRLGNAPPGILYPDVEKGFQEWLRTRTGPDDVAGFLAKLREAELARRRQDGSGLYEYVRSNEEAFSERWERIQRYPWNVRFEFLFLAGLILFMAWPWLRGAGRVGWAVHLGLLPILFFLPYWLGYARSTFTSIGPSGGILYPWLLGMFGGLPWTSLDTTILRSLPPVLEPLSQTSGPMFSLTFFRGVGLLAATGMGVLLGLTPFLGEAVRRLRRLGNTRKHVVRIPALR